MANRLALETSPYLLQHQDNPVDWQPWGEAALEQARREDKPILLSIGYSSCHWCHVMAHECFADAEVAAVMNRLFVNIKVDREERPDLDQIYQHALQLLTRQAGGWPLTLFLSPDQTPFFGGTYFPKQPRYGLPGFVALMEHVAQAYRQRRGDIEAQNAALRALLSESASGDAPAAELDAAAIAAAVAQLKQGFDALNGGYGGAPKFPRPADLEFLLHRGDGESREQALFTLRRMAEGGLFDQLGGGFFRYSVDVGWHIPHFEKMLYDNGPLLGLYADAWALTEAPQLRRAVELTVDWLAREMTAPEGAFYAALDADSEHEEGKYYVWERKAVRDLLTAEEYAVAGRCWGLDATPNFENHAWHLGRDQDLEEAGAVLGISVAETQLRLEGARHKLLAVRQQRVRPGRDDKLITSWNALAIKGLARAGRRMQRPDWVAMARRAAAALRAMVWRDGRLLATWKDGQARHNGYLDDYAFLLDALLELLQADYRPEDMDWARQLADALLQHFEDGTAGGFWFTSHDHERLIQRTKPPHDQASPSGNGIAAQALGRLGHLLGELRYLRAGERALRCHQVAIQQQPGATPSLLTALAEHLHPPRVVVLRGPDESLRAWHQAVCGASGAATLVLALPADLENLPDVLSRPVRSYVSATLCSGVNCLPEIVQLHDLLAILRDASIH